MDNRITDGVVGWRGVMGRICPAPPSSVWAVDFHSVMPDGIELKLATLDIVARSEAEAGVALAKLDEAAGSLARGGVGYIALDGTPLFAVKGLDYDAEIVKRIEKKSGVPAATSFTATLEALQTLKLKRLVMVSPMTQEYERSARQFLEAHGFEIIHTRSLNIKDYREIRVLPRSAAYKLAREAFMEAKGAGGLLILSGAWCPPFVIDCLERDLGVAAVHPLQATAWMGLKALRVKDRVTGWGRLFDTL
ncbi:MAG: hypothetical protein HYY29_02070 [Chloroflexi bacterium]|nr:hypothetical protein [Chloroflexota bacterium]